MNKTISGSVKDAIQNIIRKKGYQFIKTKNLQELLNQARRSKLNRNDYIFSHAMSQGFPIVKYSFIERIKKPSEEDIIIARRLLKAYKTSLKEENSGPKPKEDIWEILQNGPHHEFINLLSQNNPKSLALYLCNMYAQQITHGLAQGYEWYKALISDENTRANAAASYKDKLVSLAELLGCISYEDPEQGRWEENIHMDVDYLVSEIEKVLHVNLEAPKFLGGLFGIVTKRGILDARFLYSIYTVWRISSLLKKPKINSVICEIGGGIGHAAYCSYKFGLKDYTIFDLPYICVVSGYFLLKSLPKGRVLLYGEKSKNSKNRVKIYPFWVLNKSKNKSFDITFNSDSFPEIDPEIVNWYLSLIKNKTRNYLLSINQEGNALRSNDKHQIPLPDMIKSHKGYKKLYRFPYWMREGYIEELYRIT